MRYPISRNKKWIWKKKLKESNDKHNLIRDMSEYDIVHDRDMLEIKEWTKNQMNICSTNEVHKKRIALGGVNHIFDEHILEHL